MESTYRFVMRELNRETTNLAAVARATKVPKSTIKRIANGRTKNPGVKTVERLARHFRNGETH